MGPGAYLREVRVQVIAERCSIVELLIRRELYGRHVESAVRHEGILGTGRQLELPQLPDGGRLKKVVRSKLIQRAAVDFPRRKTRADKLLGYVLQRLVERGRRHGDRR